MNLEKCSLQRLKVLHPFLLSDNYGNIIMCVSLHSIFIPVGVTLGL
jgi:hypothetical protein